MWFCRFLSANPPVIWSWCALPTALLVTYSSKTLSWQDDKAIIWPILKLSHVVAEQVTINFLWWQCLRHALNWDYLSLSICIWKCIFHKRVWAFFIAIHSCAHNPFDSPQWGPRAVSWQVSGMLWIVTNCSRWQLKDDAEWGLHHISYTFKCAHIIVPPYKAKKKVPS